MPGDRHEFKFEIANSGDRPLKLVKAQQSCTCTRVVMPEGDIAPGSEAAIYFEVTQERYGISSNTLVLETNEADAPSHVLTAKTEVLPEFVLNPSRLFVELDAGQTAERTIDFSIHVDAQIIGVSVGAPWIASATPAENETRIVVTISAKAFDEGSHTSFIILSTTWEKRREISIPIALEVKPRFKVIPESLYLGRMEHGVAYPTRYVLVTESGRAPDQIEILPHPPNMFATRSEQQANGTRVYVEIADKGYIGAIDGQMEIRIPATSWSAVVPLRGSIGPKFPGK